MLDFNLQVLKSRINDNVLYSPEGCWLWTGHLNLKDNGYGQMQFNSIVSSAHRWSALAYGLITSIHEDILVLHRCDVKRCVNPEHLEAVTGKENVLRGISPVSFQAKQTHCLRGHLLSGDNIFTGRSRASRRICKICERIRASRKSHPDRSIT